MEPPCNHPLIQNVNVSTFFLLFFYNSQLSQAHVTTGKTFNSSDLPCPKKYPYSCFLPKFFMGGNEAGDQQLEL